MTKSRKPHAEDIAALNEQKISYGTALKSVLDKYGITVDELAKELRNSRINFKKIVDSYEKNKRHYAKGWKKLGKPQFEAMIQQLGALTPNAIQQILEGSYDFTSIFKTFRPGEIIHYYPTEQYLPNLLTPADTAPTKKPSSFWRAMDAVLLITVFRLAVAHSEGQEEAENLAHKVGALSRKSEERASACVTEFLTAHPALHTLREDLYRVSDEWKRLPDAYNAVTAPFSRDRGPREDPVVEAKVEEPREAPAQAAYPEFRPVILQQGAKNQGQAGRIFRLVSAAMKPDQVNPAAAIAYVQAAKDPEQQRERAVQSLIACAISSLAQPDVSIRADVSPQLLGNAVITRLEENLTQLERRAPGTVLRLLEASETAVSPAIFLIMNAPAPGDFSALTEDILQSAEHTPQARMAVERLNSKRENRLDALHRG